MNNTLLRVFQRLGMFVKAWYKNLFMSFIVRIILVITENKENLYKEKILGFRRFKNSLKSEQAWNNQLRRKKHFLYQCITIKCMECLYSMELNIRYPISYWFNVYYLNDNVVIVVENMVNLKYTYMHCSGLKTSKYIYCVCAENHRFHYFYPANSYICFFSFFYLLACTLCRWALGGVRVLLHLNIYSVGLSWIFAQELKKPALYWL